MVCFDEYMCMGVVMICPDITKNNLEVLIDGVISESESVGMYTVCGDTETKRNTINLVHHAGSTQVMNECESSAPFYMKTINLDFDYIELLEPMSCQCVEIFQQLSSKYKPYVDEKECVLKKLEDLEVATRVQARYGGSQKWCGATISKVTRCDNNSSVSYSLNYDDGYEEQKAHRMKIRLPGQKQCRVLNVGDEVDALCDDCENAVLPGTVIAKCGDDMYNVRFNLRELGVGDSNEVVKALHRSHVYGPHFSVIDNAAGQ
mmetsp:Transcript_13735/g.20571  ORF Transcript_13735/g.20571 Transcript_13735/m.20571 type:complete len:261 (+) Transcript_13735:2056-2838(+)